TSTPTATLTFTPTPTFTSTPTPTPFISFTKSSSETTAQSGDIVTYTLHVMNTGASPLSGMNITDNLPPTVGVSYITGCATGASYNPVLNSLGWTNLTVRAGSSLQLTYRVLA